jgi:hypothetical protein
MVVGVALSQKQVSVTQVLKHSLTTNPLHSGVLDGVGVGVGVDGVLLGVGVGVGVDALADGVGVGVVPKHASTIVTTNAVSYIKLLAHAQSICT